jgi:hypothetical protein
MADRLSARLIKNPQVIEPRNNTSLRPSPTPKANISGGQSKGGAPQGM